ncbi:MAG: hypothetical protein HY821_04020 [Acidobacteria bacterium]|nr:hypothetical protein [Acidobacteriota bacterium]
MKKFKFPLEKLRGLRQVRLEMVQAQMMALLAERSALEQRQLMLDRQELNARDELRVKRELGFEELSAMEGFRRWAELERERMRRSALQLNERVEDQRKALLEARRDVEALNRLRDRKLTGWRQEVDQEMESTVAELVIARWRREGGAA